jgi:hypothetical protein
VSVNSRGTLVQLETPDGFRGRTGSVEHAVGVGGSGRRAGRAGRRPGAASASAVAVAVIAGMHPALRRWRRPVPAGPEA